MTETRIEGTATRNYGRLQSAFGDTVGDAKSQVQGGVNQAKGAALEYFGKAVDAVEANVHRAPADFQPAARKAVQFSRERPFLTMFGLAAAAALVLSSGRRRR